MKFGTLLVFFKGMLELCTKFYACNIKGTKLPKYFTYLLDYIKHD